MKILNYPSGRVSIWLLAVMLAMFVFLAWYARQPLSLKAPSGPGGGADLVEEAAGGIRYTPAKGGTGVPMRFDALDLERRPNLPFFVDHGYIGLKGQGDKPVSREWISSLGFPLLQLPWPSLHMPPQAACDGKSVTLAEACPVFAMRLVSRGGENDVARLLAGTASLPSQQQVAFERRQVGQWTAFYTRDGANGAGPQWAGWLCDAKLLAQKNQAIDAWGPEDGQWALHPEDTAAHCFKAQGLLERWWPRMAGLQQHPVLWRCPALPKTAPARERGDTPFQAECQVNFVHAGRMVELHVPGTATTADSRPAAARLRPQLIESVWRTLQDGAAEPPVLPGWQAALKQELAWCQQIDADAQRLLQAGHQSPEELKTAFRRRPYQVTQTLPQGPCARALHRVIAQWLRTPEGAKPDAALLPAARALGQIEQRHTRDVEEPLWALVDALQVRDGGLAQPSVLLWRTQQPWVQRKPQQALAAYDALGAGISALYANQRIRLRQDLAHVLSRGDREHPRTPGLMWAAADEWVQINAASRPSTPAAPVPAATSPGDAPALDDADAVALLTFAASYARKPALDSGTTHPRLEKLILAMERLARDLSQRPLLSPAARRVQVSTLAVHAAWHANVLAVKGTDPARWRAWLDQWAAWAPTALPPPLPGSPEAQAAERGLPRWIQAVSAHRDAARAGRMTDPDCPGGPHTGCLVSVGE